MHRLSPLSSKSESTSVDSDFFIFQPVASANLLGCFALSPSVTDKNFTRLTN